jgi:hypothetical protein
MGGFLYYAAGGKRSIALAEAKTLGLGYAFDRQITSCGVERGPDGAAGTVVADPSRIDPSRIGYYPDAQTWRVFPNPQSLIPNPLPSVWIGYATAEPPGPADLIRLRPLDGHWVELADGRPWLVPIARGYSSDGSGGYLALPQTIALDAVGKWDTGRVIPKYEALWSLAQRWWDSLIGARPAADSDAARSAGEGLTTVVFEFSDWIDAAVTALAANYRVGPIEVDLLGLLTTETPRAILNALVDWPAVEAYLKKKLTTPEAGARGTSSGTGGPPDSIPATGPASPTSGS